VLQRFPNRDWPDVSFFNGLQVVGICYNTQLSPLQFCEPDGWTITDRPHAPRLHTTILTDEGGERHYCATLTISQSYTPPIPAATVKSTVCINHNYVLEFTEHTDNDAESTASERTTDFDIDDSGDVEDVNELELLNAPAAKLYVPLCIVLVSRHAQFQTFRVSSI
jgi:hypothetical protein